VERGGWDTYVRGEGLCLGNSEIGVGQERGRRKRLWGGGWLEGGLFEDWGN